MMCVALFVHKACDTKHGIWVVVDDEGKMGVSLQFVQLRFGMRSLHFVLPFKAGIYCEKDILK